MTGRVQVDETGTERRRRQLAAAAKRSRARSALGQSVYQLSLNNNLVAAALHAARLREGRDIDYPENCEHILQALVTEYLVSLVRDIEDPQISPEELASAQRAENRSDVA